MLIPTVSVSGYNPVSSVNAVKKTEGETTVRKTDGAAEAKKPDVDTFVKSSESENVPVEPKRLSANELKNLQQQREQSFTKMLDDIISSQANAGKKAQYAKKGITKDLFTDLVVTPEQKLAAQQSIGEDGEWGVNAVATRIMDMCVALSGGDSSKIEEMRAAVDKGFQQAMGQWGGSLPSICDQTHNEINKRFDYWKENGSLDGYTYQKAAEE